MFNILCPSYPRPLSQCAPWVGQTRTVDDGLQFPILYRNSARSEIIDVLTLYPTTLMTCVQTLEYLSDIP